MSLQKSPPLPMGEPASFSTFEWDESWVDFSGGTLSPKSFSPLSDKDFHISPKTKAGPNNNQSHVWDQELTAVPPEHNVRTVSKSRPELPADAANATQDAPCSNPHDLDMMNHKALSPNRGGHQNQPPQFIDNHTGLFSNMSQWAWDGSQNAQFDPYGTSYPADSDVQYQYPDPMEAMAQVPYPWPTGPGVVGLPVSGAVVNNSTEYYAHRELPPLGGGVSQQQTSYPQTEAQTSYPQAVAHSQLSVVPGGHLQTGRSSAVAEDPTQLYNVDRDNRGKKYRAEKPLRDEDHNWLRTNNTTVGLSTRTGKINAYDPNRDGKYCNTEHPVGDWTSLSGTAFKYTRYGELQRLSFSVEEMQDFLFGHPLGLAANGRLTLWIQKTPADSGRRYPTVGSSKCRFKDCPASIFSRSIGIGHFRVAIDEQWETSRASRDPYHVAMYVHLYCLERFCNFPFICNTLNVRGDNRELISEPKGNFMPALDSNQFSIADTFIKACQLALQPTEYPDYPQHDFSMPTAEKNHAGTLTCALTDAKNEGMNNAKIVMMEARGLSESNLLVNRGDLQMAVDARKAANIKRRVKNRKSSHSPPTTRQSPSRRNEQHHRSASPKDRSAKSPLSSRELPRRSAREAAIKALNRLVETREKESKERADRLAVLQAEAVKRKRSLTTDNAGDGDQAPSKRARTDANTSAAPNEVVESSQPRKTRSPSKSTVRNYHETFGSNGDLFADSGLFDEALMMDLQSEILMDPAILKEAPKAAPEHPVFF